MTDKFDFDEALKAIQSGQAISGKDGVLAPLILNNGNNNGKDIQQWKNNGKDIHSLTSPIVWFDPYCVH